jgi:hypothetical protein
MWEPHYFREYLFCHILTRSPDVEISILYSTKSSLSEAEPIIGSSCLPTAVDEEEDMPVTSGQTQMPTLPPLTEPRRSPRRHGDAKEPGMDDVSASSQSTLSYANTAGTSTMPAVPGHHHKSHQSPCVRTARALAWHTLSEKSKERERIEARARMDAILAEKAKELAAAVARSKELAAAAARSKGLPTAAAL